MGRIVISADSHTQLLVDLRPYLPTPLHGAFEDGLREAEALFRAVLNQPEENREAWAEALESILADEISRPFEYEEYARPVPMADRLKVIDEDGVAAEFIVPHMGAYGPPDFMHECTLAYHRWWQDYVSPAPYRFTGSTILNLACEIDQVVAEVSEAYEHGLRAVSMAGNVAMASPDLPMITLLYYYPLWEALHERSMTLVFHPGHGARAACPRTTWDGSGLGPPPGAGSPAWTPQGHRRAAVWWGPRALLAPEGRGHRSGTGLGHFALARA